jgi:CHASE2 domain-containing sensor protein
MGLSLDRLVIAGYWYVTKSKGRFYIYLAIFCSIVAILDTTVFHKIRGMKYRTFDLIMKNRISYQKADQDILLVDIDEGSLEAMAKEFGRWPWPRQVFAEFVENVEEQKPKAIIFDILFSDADVYNPDSDAYFNEAVAGTDNTFFPMLRLNPENDKLSQITPQMIQGMGKVPGANQEDKGFAVVLPHFTSIIESGRMGTNNIYPDLDGKVRRYAIYRDHYGWQIPSLPTKIAEKFVWKPPETQDIILNWRGKMGAFKTVRFSDVYEDLLRREKKRPANEFTDKIVIIGSTASILFDTKPTPMEKVHPGVEILATAIDNIKNGDWITQITNPWFFSAATLALIWLTAMGFLTGINRKLIDGVFAGSQAGLIAISYASLNLSTFYIDLTAPITAGFIYFFLARVYAYAETTLTERRVWLNVEKAAEGWQQTVVGVLQFETLKESKESKVLLTLKRRLNERKPGFTVEAFPSKPAGIGRAYGHLFLIYHVENEVVKGDWQASEQGNETMAVIEEVAKNISSKVKDNYRLGVSQGVLPFGDEKSRLKAWQKLVTHAILNLQDIDEEAS